MNTENFTIIENQQLKDKEIFQQQDNQIGNQSPEIPQQEVTENQNVGNQVEPEQNSQERRDLNQQDQSNDSNQKINALYFIGINSLTLNLIISMKSIYTLQAPLIIILVNLAVYLSLYRQKEVKSLSSKSYEKSKQIYKKAKSQFTKERILIGLLIVFASTLFLINIDNAVEAFELQEDLAIKLKRQQCLDQKVHETKLELLHQQFQNQQVNSRKNDIIQLNNQFNQMNDKLYNRILQLNHLQQQQQSQIHHLKQQINNQSEIDQSNSFKPLSQNEKQQKQYEQANTNKQHQSSNTLSEINDIINGLFNQIQQKPKEQQQQYQQKPEQVQRQQEQKQQQQIKYIRPYHLSQQKQQEKPQQAQQSQNPKINNQPQTPQQNNSNQNIQQTHQQAQQSKEYKDSRLNFLTEQFKQLNSIIQSS